MQDVWIVVTELNGYCNFFGSFVYTSKIEAEELAETLRERQYWDDIYVVPFWLK